MSGRKIEPSIDNKKKKVDKERKGEMVDYEMIIMGMKIRVKLILFLMFHAQT